MKAIGIDHGSARIGIAVSDDLGLLAHPHSTLDARSGPDPAARIAELARELGARVVVLGLPRNLDGSEGPATARVRKFAARLEPLLACELRLIDERLTTVAAQRMLHEAGRDTRRSRPVIDQVAAQMLLQSFLDAEALRSGSA